MLMLNLVIPKSTPRPLQETTTVSQQAGFSDKYVFPVHCQQGGQSGVWTGSLSKPESYCFFSPVIFHALRFKVQSLCDT